MNYFYTDSTGFRVGPISHQQLQTLATKKVIKPNTLLETDSGHRGLAEQIPGLDFNNTAMDESTGTSVFSWLFDFAFQDIRLPIINLWACRIFYVIGWIVAAIGTFLFVVETGAFERGGAPIIFVLPIAFIVFVLIIFCIRLICEWYIILFDWIVETTKAARLYREEKTRQEQ